jgi:hypothetical protein
MIPLHSFNTPDEAYRWAQKIKGKFIITGQQPGFTAWYLLIDLGPSCITLCAMPKRRAA